MEHTKREKKNIKITKCTQWFDRFYQCPVSNVSLIGGVCDAYLLLDKSLELVMFARIHNLYPFVMDMQDHCLDMRLDSLMEMAFQHLE